MNWTNIVFQTIGGLGLFLMGMKFMSDGMQKVAGDRLRKILNFLTSNRLMAILVGFLVTAVIQSSSATTVMVVGFVNASLISLTQAIGVVLGANIGTTITGWIVTLKVVKFSMPIIGMGVLIRFVSKSEKWKYYGEIIFGFGLLFLGMHTMKMGFAPLRESADFIAFFTKVDGSGFGSVFLGVVIGALSTLLVQSSSATIGITIALASQGLLGFHGAVALIMGGNIGTTITAILASLGGNYHAKRAAFAHTLFNVMGVLVAIALFYPFNAMIENLVAGASDFTIKTAEEATQFGAAMGTKPFIGAHIAMAHTIFNFANVIIFAFLVPLLARICRQVIPEPKKSEEARAFDFSHIDHNLFETPALGIVETEKKLTLMASKVAKSALVVQDIIGNKGGQEEMCDTVLKNEKLIDEYQKFITEFLVSFSSSALSEADAHQLGGYMALSHNLEKYADHLEHIALNFDKIDRKKLVLSDEARVDLMAIFKENTNFFNSAFNVLSEPVDAHAFMDKSYVLNRRIKKLIKDAKLEHFIRIKKKVCKNDAAIHYMDLLNYSDGMRSQALNIAEVTTGTKYNLGH
ncbi:MAG: Na/Pi cotransporter family protein [bacterium]|nr:Na/Pi cotransporter family protein [bacterium]